MSSNASSLVSVVIPAFNAASTLAETLDALLLQSWPATEIIVVDDGSTDDTAEVLARYSDRVRAIHQPNHGLAGARKTGIEAAQGEFIALMDADDLCHPHRLAVQVQYLREHQDVVLCSSDFSAFNASGPVSPSHAAAYYSTIGQSPRGVRSLYPCHESMQPDWGEAPPAGTTWPTTLATCRGDVFEALAHGNFVHPPTVMFRRSLLRLAGNFDEQARTMCDWDWLSRASRVGQFGYIEWPLLNYRLSPQQMSSARHRARSMADILHVAERICHRNPAFYMREHHRFSRELADYCLWSADARAQTERTEALKLLARCVIRHGHMSEAVLRILFKVLTPTWLVQAMRLGRKRRGIA